MSTDTAKKSWKDKYAAATNGKDENAGALRYLKKSFAIWVLLTSGLGYLMYTGAYTPKPFNRGMSDIWYLYTASAFFLGISFAVLGYCSARNSEKKNLAAILMIIDFVAMSSYIIQAMRWTPTLNGLNGVPIDPSRFLEWFATCPVLIYMIAEITKNHEMAKSLMINDYLLLVFGFFASIMREPFSSWMNTLSCICFMAVVQGLFKMYQAAIDGETGCKLDTVGLRVAQFSTCLAWTLFPIVWILQMHGMVTYAVGEALYCVTDIVAKVFLTLVLVNATVEQAQNERVDILTGIASELEEQMSNSDKLLERMMPANVLEQIKQGKGTEAKEYENVTVFFSDIANFTVLSSRTSTKDMLASLNKLWVEYDAIAKRWGIYKVETIGDAYLGVAGCPDVVPDHAARAVNFSLDILEMVKTFKTVTNENIQIRIGLNSGPVTAGILGELNPHWCLVGDTVNTASRMESTSKAMHIHISESTYKMIKNSNFNISEPDVLTIKGKGTMTTYWVHGRK